MRRGIGVSGLVQKQAERAKYAEEGNKMQAKENEELEILYEEFKKQLELFSNENYEEIAKNAELREKLTILCNKFDINILSKKNVFHSVIGNFYLQLSVFVIEILNEQQIIEKNTLSDLLTAKTKQSITNKDIDQCLKSLKPLGHLNVIIIENKEYLSTVQVEHTQLLTRKSWTVTEIAIGLNLSTLVAETYFEELLRVGIGWLDEVDHRIYIGT